MYVQLANFLFASSVDIKKVDCVCANICKNILHVRIVISVRIA